MTTKTLQVGPIMANCYLLCDEDAKVCALIDPGDDAARGEQLVRQSGCGLKYILLTHGHFAHTPPCGPCWRDTRTYRCTSTRRTA